MGSISKASGTALAASMHESNTNRQRYHKPLRHNIPQLMAPPGAISQARPRRWQSHGFGALESFQSSLVCCMRSHEKHAAQSYLAISCLYSVGHPLLHEDAVEVQLCGVQRHLLNQLRAPASSASSHSPLVPSCCFPFCFSCARARVLHRSAPTLMKRPAFYAGLLRTNSTSDGHSHCCRLSVCLASHCKMSLLVLLHARSGLCLSALPIFV